MNRVGSVLLLACLGLFAAWAPVSFAEDAPAMPSRPRILINGEPATVTIQDLSGLGTRPMRLLVERNNQAHSDERIQVYAVGARTGDQLRLEWAALVPGTRATLYRVFHGLTKADRYLNMPVSGYFAEPGAASYEEKIDPFREEFFVLVFDRTGNAAVKNLNVSYFDEPGRRLSMASYKTNLLFSSLKFKMKDPQGGFVERDAQDLVDRFTDPQRIFLIRVWKADKN